MYYWRKQYFQTLKDVAAEANKAPAWIDYATFCLEYEAGFRKQAFTTLGRFISEYERASFSDRRRFVSWVLSQAEGREGRHMLLPHPLHVRLVEPTLLEWTIIEPTCSEPHRWLGGYEHLRQAIELDPGDQLARRKLIVCIMSRVSFAAHELPKGYLETPKEDLAALAEAEELVPALQNEQDRAYFASQIKFDRTLIENYLHKTGTDDSDE
jgi:hypothetical protein